MCSDIKETIIPDIILPIKTPNKEVFILILRIDAIAEAVQVPVVGRGIPTKSIIPNIDILFNRLIPLSILLSTFFTKGKNISIFLKKFNICLKVRISGIDTIVDPITLAIYTPIGFKSIAIPIGIAPLNSVNGSIAKSIISKYPKVSLHINSNPDLFYNI